MKNAVFCINTSKTIIRKHWSCDHCLCSHRALTLFSSLCLFCQQWHGRPGQASLPHLNLKDLQMSDSRELSNIVCVSASTPFCFAFFFLPIVFFWRIWKVPKTATVPSPICRPGALLLLYFFFFYSSVNSPFIVRAVGFKLMPTTGNEDQKNVFSFWIF